MYANAFSKEQARNYPNLKLISAYMPEAFGTHHSKMMILIRHDDTAQYVIQGFFVLCPFALHHIQTLLVCLLGQMTSHAPWGNDVLST